MEAKQPSIASLNIHLMLIKFQYTPWVDIYGLIFVIMSVLLTIYPTMNAPLGTIFEMLSDYYHLLLSNSGIESWQRLWTYYQVKKQITFFYHRCRYREPIRRRLLSCLVLNTRQQMSLLFIQLNVFLFLSSIISLMADCIRFSVAWWIKWSFPDRWIY